MVFFNLYNKNLSEIEIKFTVWSEMLMNLPHFLCHRSVEHHRHQLEQAILSLQTSLETKEDALDGLRQDLEQSQVGFTCFT